MRFLYTHLYFCWIILIQVKCDEKNSTTIVESDSARLIPPPVIGLFPPLLYPTNAATGILVAIAIPLTDTDNENVFLSYNFEANYNMPYCPAEAWPGPPIRIPGLLSENTTTNLNEDYPNPQRVRPTCERTSLPENRNPFKKRSVENPMDKVLLTRKGVYSLIEHRLYSNGIEGKKCLLLAICESAKLPFESNGVIGQILHIVLTPSSSMDEKLPPEFTKAERLGNNGNCRKYEKKCNVNILNVISKII